MGISKRYKRRWRRQIINDILCLAKGIGFYPGDLRWESDPIRGVFEKDYYISSVKDKSDRDLKHEEPLIDRRDAKSSIDSAH